MDDQEAGQVEVVDEESGETVEIVEVPEPAQEGDDGKGPKNTLPAEEKLFLMPALTLQEVSAVTQPLQLFMATMYPSLWMEGEMTDEEVEGFLFFLHRTAAASVGELGLDGAIALKAKIMELIVSINKSLGIDTQEASQQLVDELRKIGLHTAPATEEIVRADQQVDGFKN